MHGNTNRRNMSGAFIGPKVDQTQKICHFKVVRELVMMLGGMCCPNLWCGKISISSMMIWQDYHGPRTSSGKLNRTHASSLDIPKPRATAGGVLQHSINLFEKLLEANKPMSFKFGITHDPAIRWHNSTFGYKVSRERFQHLIAIYAASNPHGPAFLEAALIDRFGSFLLAQSYDMHAWFSSMAHGYVMFFWKCWFAILIYTFPQLRLAGVQKWTSGWRFFERCWLWTLLYICCLYVLERTKHAGKKPWHAKRCVKEIKRYPLMPRACNV